MTPDRGVFHKLEKTGLSDFILIKDIKELEYELEMILFLLIDERFNCFVVIGQIHNDLEVILEAW